MRPASSAARSPDEAPEQSSTGARRRFAVPPGIRHMAIGAFWFSVMSLLVRIAGQRIPSMEIVFFRGAFTLALTWAALRHARVSPWGRQRGLLVLRGLFGSLALSCFFFSLVHLPLGDATLIQYTNPVFASLFAAFFLGERMGKAEVVSLVASFIGVVLIARPAALFGLAAAPFEPHYVAIALAGGMLAGAGYTVVRKIGTTEHRLVVVFYLPLLTIPISLPLAIFDWRWPTAREWLVLVGVGLATQLAQVHMTRGLQLESAARATTTGYLQIVFAVLWGAILLGELPNAWTLAGAIIIIGGTLLLIARKGMEAVPDE